MTYFSLKDHQSLAFRAGSLTSDDDAQLTYDKLLELHHSLHRRLRDHNYDLHPHWNRASIVTSGSVTAANEAETLTLSYFRSQEQATLVERLMGRDRLDRPVEVEMYRHPVVELRLTPNHFAVELVLTPDAWWDQQNFIGKLAIPRHRETLRQIMQRMDGDFNFGFWDGADLSDMHLTTKQLARSAYMTEWMNTFCDGQDWLRLGMWYTPEDERLDTTRIVSELARRVGALYSVYTFLLWTSNNDFHNFYHKSSIKTPSIHHA